MKRLRAQRWQGVPLEAWARQSGRYDRQLWLERAAVRVALDLANPGPDDRLLDLGTGTGAVLRELTTRPTRPRRAVGVDASTAMLAEVPALPGGWTLCQADARALPFSSGVFDVAVASYVLHVLPDAALSAALAELARVITPNGSLVTVTPVVPTGGFLRPLGIASDGLARLAPARLGGLRAFDPRPALEGAGFTLTRARASRHGYRSLSVLSHPPA